MSGDIITCPDCGGSGRVTRKDSEAWPYTSPCPRCDGTGQVQR